MNGRAISVGVGVSRGIDEEEEPKRELRKAVSSSLNVKEMVFDPERDVPMRLPNTRLLSSYWDYPSTAVSGSGTTCDLT